MCRKTYFKKNGTEIKSNQLLKADKTEVENLQARILKPEGAKKEQDNALIMWKSYEKRFNVLIHGIPEQEESAWETPPPPLQQTWAFIAIIYRR